MHIVLLLVLVLLLVFGPQWWARYTFRRYAGASPNVPGTGAELARHLLNRFGMKDVGVEPAEQGADHYDPEQRVVRLGPDNYNGKSLTAVAVAAHEVGHAIQHQRNDTILVRDPFAAWRRLAASQAAARDECDTAPVRPDGRHSKGRVGISFFSIIAFGVGAE